MAQQAWSYRDQADHADGLSAGRPRDVVHRYAVRDGFGERLPRGGRGESDEPGRLRGAVQKGQLPGGVELEEVLAQRAHGEQPGRVGDD